MSVTVLTALYGSTHTGFLERWLTSINDLDSTPDAVIVATPERFGPSSWQYPTAFYFDQGFRAATTDWVWVLGIDDLALQDALDGIDEVSADVWQMGFLDGLGGGSYLPPQLTAKEVLALDMNRFCACSAIRRETYLRSGGFPDVSLEDWALWRRLAVYGATFESSGRAHYRYMRHDQARSKTEAGGREDHMEEMMAA